MDIKLLAFWAAVALAMCAGCLFWKAYVINHRRSRIKRTAVASSIGSNGVGFEGMADGLDKKVIESMVRSTQAASVRSGDDHVPFRKLFSEAGKSWFSKNIIFTGLSEQIDIQGFNECRLKMALGVGAIAALVGSVISLELALIGGIAGAAFGWSVPKSALKRTIKWRSHQMEHHLPEMLDVVALGMRSGLSFDSSVGLYTSHFQAPLARDMATAQRKWNAGLEPRNEALRKVASTYESPVFSRVVETVVRSIRFGSSMVEGLEAESAEARAAYKARREEQVAKAPVKMMVPTGVLILPAMLILVLGPVLLELMEGGV